MDWVFTHAASLRFRPRLITVEGATFVEEFEVEVTLRDGRRLRSRWAEILEFRENFVTSLCPYFDPLELLEAEGRIAAALAPLVRRFARRRLHPLIPPSVELRAGDGNRTRTASLEGWGSTIELRPRQLESLTGC